MLDFYALDAQNRAKIDRWLDQARTDHLADHLRQGTGLRARLADLLRAIATRVDDRPRPVHRRRLARAR